MLEHPEHPPGYATGSNQNSVLLPDNCSIHRVPQFQQVFSDAQVLTHYLPPYSPDYNPIELAFSKVKYLLKAMEAEMQAIQDTDTILLAAFAQITQADCSACMDKQYWHLLVSIIIILCNLNASQKVCFITKPHYNFFKPLRMISFCSSNS